MGSPLAAWHADHGATMTDIDGVSLPARYTGVDAEIAAARSGVGLLDLSHLPTITIESSDAKRWCNGMFTNNIRKMSTGEGSRSAMCDDRGRVQGLIDLYCTSDDSFFAVLDGVDLGWFNKRYGMYMVLDDIEMEDCSEELVVLSMQGPGVDALLAAVSLPVPEVERGHLTGTFGGAELRVARRDRTGLSGVDLFVPQEVAGALWAALSDAGATPLGHEALDALRILDGRARWPNDGTAKSMVHELRINEECCAFDKGCYVGQEVINRIDVKGAIQKRLTGLRINGTAPIGAKLLLGERKIGTLTSTAVIDGEQVGLAVLRKVAWEPGTVVTIQPEDGEALSATVADFSQG
ncbi:MAG: folate-binding protein YgfZ [Myxococcota bacterium]|jgi:folate-binding protein YgfZ